MSGPGYLLQTVHLELQSWGYFIQNPDNQRNYPGLRKDRNSSPFKLTKFWFHLYASSLNSTDQAQGQQILRNKCQLAAPLYNG